MVYAEQGARPTPCGGWILYMCSFSNEICQRNYVTLSSTHVGDGIRQQTARCDENMQQMPLQKHDAEVLKQACIEKLRQYYGTIIDKRVQNVSSRLRWYKRNPSCLHHQDTHRSGWSSKRPLPRWFRALTPCALCPRVVANQCATSSPHWCCQAPPSSSPPCLVCDGIRECATRAGFCT